MKIILETNFSGGAQTYILQDNDGDLYWNRSFNKESAITLDPTPLKEVSDWNIFKQLYRRYYLNSSEYNRVDTYIDFLDKSRRLFFDRRPNAYRKTVV